MKKLLVMLTMVMTFAFASVCAAFDGDALNKEQKAAELLNQMAAGQEVKYSKVADVMDENLKKSMDQETLAKIQNKIRRTYGSMQGIIFKSFERFSDGDKVTYVAAFEKARKVSLVYIFNKEQEMMNFQFTTLAE